MDDESSTQEGIQKPPGSSNIKPELTYEETPIITPIEPEKEINRSPVDPVRQKPSFWSLIKKVLLFIILFLIGYWLSGIVRTLFENRQRTPQPQPEMASPTQNPLIEPFVASTTGVINQQPTPQTTLASSYSVLNGITRLPIAGIQYQLPAGVLAPVCDGTACGSQGTYLPGGTRFTIAPRGAGQVLMDFRGKTITDAGGKAFITKPTTVAGKNAIEFTTETRGSTIGGHAFTTMRGVMIELSDTLSLEINHFVPVGIRADFAADEVIFNELLKTLVLPGNGVGGKGSVITPTPSLIPTSPTPEALTPIR